MIPLRSILSILILMIGSDAFGKLTLPSYFQDHMVIQQLENFKLKGTASPNAQVNVQWMNSVFYANATKDGAWELKLTSGPHGGPYSLIVKSGREKITVNDILLGDVWLCAGQSNMEWRPVQGLSSGMDEIDKANNSKIKLLNIPRNGCSAPQQNIIGEWQNCTSKHVKQFSAVGYFFGEKLQSTLDIPIGLIYSTWGGTRIEYWMDEDIISHDPRFSDLLELRKNNVVGEKLNAFPSAIYNGMIYPLIDMPIKGVIWYQGETNVDDPLRYKALLPAMIESWRKAWQRDFDFYIVQIAPYKYDNPLEAVLIREAQLNAALNLPKTGLVVTTDIGDWNDIHPLNKLEVANRLSFLALNKTYGDTSVVACGPIFKNMSILQRQIFLEFENLNFTDDTFRPLLGFEVAGSDSVYYKANAFIRQNTVVISSPEVGRPLNVRFGFNLQEVPNFFNEAGLPASPFRTDDWPLLIH
jgi:sialate O-acetylesterase